MKDKKKKAKRKLGLLQKILLGVLGVVVLAVLIWFAYYMFHYYLYDDYKQYLNGYETEMGTDFHSLKDSSKDVDNMELVAENGNLKLYASPESGNVAIYDKRSGVTTYSNPVNADEDPIANNTNKNYLKSQFVINYTVEYKHSRLVILRRVVTSHIGLCRLIDFATDFFELILIKIERYNSGRVG